MFSMSSQIQMYFSLFFSKSKNDAADSKSKRNNSTVTQLKEITRYYLDFSFRYESLSLSQVSAGYKLADWADWWARSTDWVPEQNRPFGFGRLVNRPAVDQWRNKIKWNQPITIKLLGYSVFDSVRSVDTNIKQFLSIL